MNDWIELTVIPNKKKILFNVRHIIDIFEDGDAVKVTTVQLKNGSSTITVVAETMGEIWEKIDG